MAPSPTLTSVALTLNTPGVGATVQATALATMSNGTTSAITTGFGGDAAAVATVSSSGSVTGVSIGDVTVFVDYQGMRGTSRIHVLPNYSGIFIGTYTIDSCVDSGGVHDTGFCDTFTVGRSLPIGLNNTQSNTLTSVVGQFALGSLVGSANGTVSNGGELTYSGVFTSGTLKIDLQNLVATSPAVGQMAGHFTQLWTDTTLTGAGTLQCTLVGVVRTSGGAALAAMPGGAPLRLADAFRAALIRR
jgi:hypothetical protein